MIDKVLVTMVLISILLCKSSFLFKGKKKKNLTKSTQKLFLFFIKVRVMKLYGLS